MFYHAAAAIKPGRRRLSVYKREPVACSLAVVTGGLAAVAGYTFRLAVRAALLPFGEFMILWLRPPGSDYSFIGAYSDCSAGTPRRDYGPLILVLR